MARETPSFRVPGAGHWKLVAEREPAARPSPFGGETSISWAPALPGPHSIGEAPSDAGFMLYHVGDTLCFFDQRGAKADSTDTLQLRDRVLCHDLHWSCPPPGAGAGSSSANGGGGGGFGGASLEALVGLSSGEVVLWRPFSRRETSRGLSSAVAGGGEGAVADARWRPSPEAESGVCFGLACAGGRVALYVRRGSEEAAGGGSTPAPSPKRHGRVASMGASIRWRDSTASSSQPRFDQRGMLRASESGAAVTAIAFSPDGSRLAAATADGMLVLWSVGGDCSSRPAAESEGSSGEGEPQLLARLASYFGGLLCVAWARDGAYLLAGGEDDLVSVVSLERRAVVARAQGHSSWVHHVAFEPAPLQEGKDRPPASHAFASVGADGRICFWEFRADGKGEEGGGPPPNGVDVPSPGFREVPLLAPLASVPLHERPVAALLYGRGEMHTACAGGFVKTFARVS